MDCSHDLRQKEESLLEHNAILVNSKECGIQAGPLDEYAEFFECFLKMSDKLPKIIVCSCDNEFPKIVVCEGLKQKPFPEDKAAESRKVLQRIQNQVAEMMHVLQVNTTLREEVNHIEGECPIIKCREIMQHITEDNLKEAQCNGNESSAINHTEVIDSQVHSFLTKKCQTSNIEPYEFSELPQYKASVVKPNQELCSVCFKKKQPKCISRAKQCCCAHQAEFDDMYGLTLESKNPVEVQSHSAMKTCTKIVQQFQKPVNDFDSAQNLSNESGALTDDNIKALIEQCLCPVPYKVTLEESIDSHLAERLSGLVADLDMEAEYKFSKAEKNIYDIIIPPGYKNQQEWGGNHKIEPLVFPQSPRNAQKYAETVEELKVELSRLDKLGEASLSGRHICNKQEVSMECESVSCIDAAYILNNQIDKMEQELIQLHASLDRARKKRLLEV